MEFESGSGNIQMVLCVSSSLFLLRTNWFSTEEVAEVPADLSNTPNHLFSVSVPPREAPVDKSVLLFAKATFWEI